MEDWIDPWGCIQPYSMAAYQAYNLVLGVLPVQFLAGLVCTDIL